MSPPSSLSRRATCTRIAHDARSATAGTDSDLGQTPGRRVYAAGMADQPAAGTSGRLRIVVAKPGLDGHDRGAKVVARALRDAGVEVIYTGLHQTPEQIVATAVQEDADAVGLSILSGAHMTIFPRLLELLRANDAADIVVFGGGIVPDDDIAELKALGVAEIFTPGTSTSAIVTWVHEHLAVAGAVGPAASAPGAAVPVDPAGH